MPEGGTKNVRHRSRARLPRPQCGLREGRHASLKRHLRPWATTADNQKAGAIDERPGCSRTIRRQTPWSELIQPLPRDLARENYKGATWFKNSWPFPRQAGGPVRAPEVEPRRSAGEKAAAATGWCDGQSIMGSNSPKRGNLRPTRQGEILTKHVSLASVKAAILLDRPRLLIAPFLEIGVGPLW
jgi:hypothetical protein